MFFYKGFLDCVLMHFFPIAYRNTEQNSNNQGKNPANSILPPTLVVSVSFARKSLPGAQECLSNNLDGRHFLRRLCLTTESKESQACHNYIGQVLCTQIYANKIVVP